MKLEAGRLRYHDRLTCLGALKVTLQPGVCDIVIEIIGNEAGSLMYWNSDDPHLDDEQFTEQPLAEDPIGNPIFGSKVGPFTVYRTPTPIFYSMALRIAQSDP